MNVSGLAESMVKAFGWRGLVEPSPYSSNMPLCLHGLTFAKLDGPGPTIMASIFCFWDEPCNAQYMHKVSCLPFLPRLRG